MRLVEVGVNTTRKGEEQDVKAWEESERSVRSIYVPDTWGKHEDTGCVCCGHHVVSTQAGRLAFLEVLR